MFMNSKLLMDFKNVHTFELSSWIWKSSRILKISSHIWIKFQDFKSLGVRKNVHVFEMIVNSANVHGLKKSSRIEKIQKLKNVHEFE